MKFQLEHRDAELIRTNEELQRAWVDQINKDVGSDLFFSGSFESVREDLKVYLDTHFTPVEGQIPELLYRIDLSEMNVLKEMNSGNWGDWHELLAHAIAVREAVKVVFRFQYSGRL